MANAAFRRLRLSRNAGDEDDVNVDLDFTANADDASGSVPVVNPAASGSGAESGLQIDVADGGPKRKKNPGKGEQGQRKKKKTLSHPSHDQFLNLYESKCELDTPELDGVLYTDFLREVHEQVNIADNLLVVERQSLQHAAFLRYLLGDVVPSFTADLEKANAERESAVENLKQAKFDLDEAIKEKNKFQSHYTNCKSKYKASDSALTKLKGEFEALKYQPSGAGVDKTALSNLVKQNLQKAHAKLKEEKALLIADAEKVGSESFANVVAQLKLLNPGLVIGGVSAEHEVCQGRICKVDAERKMYVCVKSGEDVGPLDENDA